MQYFEWNLPNDGNLWNKLKQDAKHLRETGVTAVWIPPAYKADEQQDEGYATYDLYDLGEFDQKNTVRTKYGTKQELVEAIDELHKHGVQVYLDAVMNHKCGGDYPEKFMAQQVDPSNRNEPVRAARDRGVHRLRFQGTRRQVLRLQVPLVSLLGHQSGPRQRAYRQDIPHTRRGQAVERRVDSENGNYDYLLGNDLDLDHPEVIHNLLHWGMWVAKELNLDGVRLDAIKHMRDTFVKQFLETRPRQPRKHVLRGRRVLERRFRLAGSLSERCRARNRPVRRAAALQNVSCLAERARLRSDGIHRRIARGALPCQRRNVRG